MCQALYQAAGMNQGLGGRPAEVTVLMELSLLGKTDIKHLFYFIFLHQTFITDAMSIQEDDVVSVEKT